jgi:sensor domain DACNV-containing protein
MFEAELLEKIIQAWEADQKQPYKYRDQEPLLDIRDVRAIIEKSFLASIKREEERSITFSIALLPKNKVGEEQVAPGLKPIIMTFDPSLPLTVESITKLAVAFDPRTTALIAGPVDHNKTEYEIWGTILFRDRMNRFNEIPVGFEDIYNMNRPDVMIVTAVSAGSLIVTRGDSQIGRFINGEFIKAIPSPFYTKAMGNYIIDLIKGDKGYIDHQNSYWHLYRDSLDYLLREASERGHGGTIILISDKKIEDYKAFFTRNYMSTESLQIQYLLNKILTPSKEYEISIRVALNKIYSERLNILAQLTCTDGALILSSCLEVLSFGSKLMASNNKWQGDVVIGPDGFGGGGEKFDTSRLGTRHNSAINFVGACPESIAFVISQDGPVRGFTKKDNNTILCWPDCRVSMFA